MTYLEIHLIGEASSVRISATSGHRNKEMKQMSKTVRVTYEINLEEMSKEQIENLIYESLNIGFSHNVRS